VITEAETGQVIREWIVDRITLSLDNDARCYRQLQEVATAAVLAEDADAGTQFAEAARTNQLARYVRPVGDAVSDLILGWLNDGIPDPVLRLLVTDVFDLTDRRQREMLGQHFMPEEIEA
jgi:hypothetical protein